jgi:hypothetical protein
MDNTVAANASVDVFNTTMNKIIEGITAAREQQKDLAQ